MMNRREQTVICDRCGSRLSLYFEKGMYRIAPCSKCLAKEFRRGVISGQSDRRKLEEGR